MHTLLERELITEVGRAQAAGGAMLYGTTPRFEAMFGLAGLDELPPLEGFALTEDAEGRSAPPAGAAHRPGVEHGEDAPAEVLAEAGLGSRRACEELIRAGRVTVDGRGRRDWVLRRPRDPGDRRRRAPDSRGDQGVLAAEQARRGAERRDRRRGRRTVVDCVPARARVFPVGRLDLNSTGLLLLTNDGDLAARLLHPRFHVEKEYLVPCAGWWEKAALDALRARSACSKTGRRRRRPSR